MDDHYQTLGVAKTASQDEIKNAYRKLASKYHPDKGGDTATFQKIQTAYNILGDPQKRSEYDNPPNMNFHFQGPPGFNVNQGNFDDILRNFGFGGFDSIFGNRQPQRRNLSLNLHTTITLEDAFYGKDLVANVNLPNGSDQIINVNIPAGIEDGVVLKLRELGDNSIRELPRGDIHLTINVAADTNFERSGDNLIKNVDISVFDALLGTTIKIETIDKKMLNVNIHPGTQHGMTLKLQGYGMPNIKDKRFRGCLFLKISINIPTNLTEQQKQLIEQARYA